MLRKQEHSFTARIGDDLIVSVTQQQGISKDGKSYEVAFEFEYFKKDHREQDINDVEPQSIETLLEGAKDDPELNALQRAEEAFKDIAEEDLPLEEVELHEAIDKDHQKKLYQELAKIEKGEIDIGLDMDFD